MEGIGIEKDKVSSDLLSFRYTFEITFTKKCISYLQVRTIGWYPLTINKTEKYIYREMSNVYRTKRKGGQRDGERKGRKVTQHR